MSSNANYRIKVGVAIVFCAIAAIMVAMKTTGFEKSDHDDKLMPKQEVVSNEVNYIYWPGLSFDLRTVTRLKHEIWQQEDAVKLLIRAGEVAIAMEKLKELKRNYEKAEEKYNKAEMAARLADPEGFDIYEISITTWKHEVNAAHLKYRMARSIEELRIAHAEYLDKLHKAEIKLPKDL